MVIFLSIILVFKYFRLQDRLNQSISRIQQLERENAKLKQDQIELTADLDTIKVEKKRLQTLLNHEHEDKKKLTDQINTYTIIGK